MGLQNKFVAISNRKSHGSHGLPFEMQLSHIFDIPRIVNEKPSASKKKKKKKIVSRSKF